MTTVTEIATTQVYQVFIKSTPERIWEAITNPEFIRKYFYGTRAEYDLRPGGAYKSVGDESGNVIVEGEVLEVDEPRSLVQSWRFLYDPELAEEGFTKVSWEIEATEGDVSKLTVTHELEEAPKTAAHVAAYCLRNPSGRPRSRTVAPSSR